MGDRCSVEIRTRKQDREIFVGHPDLGEPWDEGETNSYVDLQYGEINYSGREARENAAAAGAVFYGSHGPGEEYGPHVFAAIDGIMHEIETGFDGNPAVLFGNDGAPLPGQFPELFDYLAALRRVREVIGDRD